MLEPICDAMNRVAHDILDLVKVNGVSWPVLGWANDWSLAWLLQATPKGTIQILTIISITIIIIYNLFKLFVAYKDYQKEYGGGE